MPVQIARDATIKCTVSMNCMKWKKLKGNSLELFELGNHASSPSFFSITLTKLRIGFE